MTKPMSRRELNKVRTREAILDAARIGFARDGVQGTTMENIAAAAEVSRATLFNYFTGKGEILDQLVVEMHEHFFARMQRCRAEIADPAERVRVVFVETGRAMEAEADRLRPIVGYSEMGWNETGVMGRLERLTVGFETLLDTGSVATEEEAHDRRVVAEMMSGIFIGMIHNWRLGENYPLEERLGEAAARIGRMFECPAT
ncbi:TetR/AcrR family transcriptional regulator [Sphingomonas sp. KC8]|uniref:TetR/AcrR family transcriptional regulator n=1 Tax=Sphingomonas sp. KC8 TaxID=1030157 RepID=UPI0002ED94E7|nr:TetR/AcrR family transcriptional regulator [Sphingomonas sp. KC8]ARS29173.1 putative TetR family transcriptional regulator [Sphingomonas sp. KC8]